MIKNAYYIETLETEPSLVIETEEEVYRMNSLMHPSYEAERWAMQFERDGRKRVYCMFGLGTGIFAEKLLERMSTDSVLIIVEPLSEVCELFRTHANRLSGDGRVFVCVGENWESAFLSGLSQYAAYEMVAGMMGLVHPVYDRLCAEEYLRFMRTIVNHRNFVHRNVATMRRFSEAFIRNIFANSVMLKNANFACELSKIIPAEIPVIVVAAGPSLDKNIECLRAAKGRSVIVAVDTAIKYLMAKDIMPDITITIDAEKSPDDYADIRSLGLPAIISSVANPKITGKLGGRIFMLYYEGFIGKMLTGAGIDVPSDVCQCGSVALAAFAWWYLLDSRCVIMIGQDLAYLGDSTHAGGIISAGVGGVEGFTMIEGIDGKPVRSRPDWISYRDWLEQSIDELLRCDGRGKRVIDATEGGALIKGTEIMSLDAAITELCTAQFDFAAAVEGLEPSITGECCERLRLLLNAVPDRLNRLEQKAEEGLAACDRLMSGRAEEKDARLAEGLKQELDSADEYSLIESAGLNEIVEELTSLRFAGNNAHENALNTVRSYRIYFEAYKKSCAAIREYLRKE